MYLIPFHLLFPEIAEKETRSITVNGKPGIPSGDYGLVETYCPDPACDCQRVMLNVLSRQEQKQVATISYGFDRSDEDAGPYLDPFNPQSSYAPALQDVIAKVLELDSAYVQRLKTHYALVKTAAADPSHPIQKKLALWQAEEQDLLEAKSPSNDLREAIRVITEHEPRLAALERKAKKPGRKRHH